MKARETPVPRSAPFRSRTGASGTEVTSNVMVFAVESADQDYMAGFAQAFTSNSNPVVALWIMWIALAISLPEIESLFFH